MAYDNLDFILSIESSGYSIMSLFFPKETHSNKCIKDMAEIISLCPEEEENFTPEQLDMIDKELSGG